MIKVYGCSDDLVEIEGDKNFDEIGCYNEITTIWFKDGTVIEVEYGKDGIWKIREVGGGHAPRKLNACDSEDIYSDIFEIDSEVLDVCVGEVVDDVRELVLKFRHLKTQYPLQFIDEAYKEVFGL